MASGKEVYIPKNLPECYAELDKLLDDSAKKQVLEKSAREFAVMSHFGLGMWMRNNWGLWRGSRLAKVLLEKGIQHPDSMSALILEGYHRHLSGEDAEST